MNHPFKNLVIVLLIVATLAAPSAAAVGERPAAIKKSKEPSDVIRKGTKLASRPPTAPSIKGRAKSLTSGNEASKGMATKKSEGSSTSKGTPKEVSKSPDATADGDSKGASTPKGTAKDDSKGKVKKESKPKESVDKKKQPSKTRHIIV